MNSIPGFEQNELKDSYNAVFTITLAELIENDIFKWDSELLNWSKSAYDNEQYERVCNYFIQRFYFREISMIPFYEWAMTLKRKIVYELMPKLIPLYKRISEGIDPLSDSNEYYKEREIQSDYPETMLSGNSDYISDGKDLEGQRIKEGNLADSYENFALKYKSVDELLLDELETMFIGMYTLNFNTTW